MFSLRRGRRSSSARVRPDVRRVSDIEHANERIVASDGEETRVRRVECDVRGGTLDAEIDDDGAIRASRDGRSQVEATHSAVLMGDEEDVGVAGGEAHFHAHAGILHEGRGFPRFVAKEGTRGG